MIFQDFMFSDSIYPASDPFLETVKQEVIYQVRRLRNHHVWSYGLATMKFYKEFIHGDGVNNHM